MPEGRHALRRSTERKYFQRWGVHWRVFMPTRKDLDSRTGLSLSICEASLSTKEGREQYARDYQAYASQLPDPITDPVGYCLVDLGEAETIPIRVVPEAVEGPCGGQHILLQFNHEDNCPTRAEAEILQANANMVNIMALPGDEEGPYYDPKAKKPSK